MARPPSGGPVRKRAVLARAEEAEQQPSPRPRPHRGGHGRSSFREAQRTRTWVARRQRDAASSTGRAPRGATTIVLDLFHVLGYLKAGHAVAVEGSKERVGVAAPRARAARSRARCGMQCHQASPVGPAARAARPVRPASWPTSTWPTAWRESSKAPVATWSKIGARTGARWRLRGAEAVLRLRALRYFDEYWTRRRSTSVPTGSVTDGQVPSLRPRNFWTPACVSSAPALTTHAPAPCSCGRSRELLPTSPRRLSARHSPPDSPHFVAKEP